jgi:hypothetical protein
LRLPASWPRAGAPIGKSSVRPTRFLGIEPAVITDPELTNCSPSATHHRRRAAILGI